jgi:hypothetical protein
LVRRRYPLKSGKYVHELCSPARCAGHPYGWGVQHGLLSEETIATTAALRLSGTILMQLPREPEPLLKCPQARNEHAVAYRSDHLVLVRFVAIEP